MRSKSEMEARDRYSRRYAAVRAAESLVSFWARGTETIIVIEAEDHELWDDVVEVDLGDHRRRRNQGKRQMTPISPDDFSNYVRSASQGDPDDVYHFVYPAPLEVERVGELRHLATLIDRVRQPGASDNRVLDTLREAEARWLENLSQWTGASRREALDFLRRVRIDFVGDEDELRRRGVRALEQLFKDRATDAWEGIVAFVADKDGVVEIHPKDLLQRLPHPADDPVVVLYWSVVPRVERGFGLDRWVGLSDHLVADLLPQWFCNGVADFLHTVASTAWPNRISAFEEAVQDLAKHAGEYLEFFNRRSDSDGRCVREDKSYRRVLDAAAIWAEDQAAATWRCGVQKRLVNLVVALNAFLDSVRANLDQTYRREGGVLGITDSLGLCDPELGRWRTYFPKRYVNLEG